MPRLFVNQQPITNDNSLPMIDTYADAILRTFASLKPSPLTTLKYRHSHPCLPILVNDSLDSQLISTESSSSSLSSSSLSTSENQFTFKRYLPFVTNKIEESKKFQRLFSRLNRIYNKKKMTTKTLLPSSSHITDRYFFRSQSNDTRLSSKTKLDNTPPTQKKRYKFSSKNNEPYTNIYQFSTNQRSHSSDSNRYYFPIDNSQQTLTYLQSGSGSEQRSVTFIEGSSTCIYDTPYRFSNTIKSKKYPSTTSTLLRPDDTWTYKRQQPQRIVDNVTDSSMRGSSRSPEYRQSTRMDAVTSTNGSLSRIKRSPTDKSPSVRFESSILSITAHSYLNEARELLSGRRGDQTPESFEKSVDRLVSSVNKKYGRQQQQQQQSMTSPSTSSSLNYISQYYAKEDKRSIENDDEQQKFYYNLNTNRTHTQIMKTVNKSLIDRNYQIDKNRLKHLEQNVRRYLRLFESQSLQRELNYDLIRCFSSSYLQDLRQEEIRQNQARSHIRSYTYEDIQDIHVPSVLEAYKMKIAIDREKHQRLHSGQLSPVSSSGYSPIMVGSLNENMDTQTGGFETDRKSFTSISQISTSLRPNVDLFYEIMQESSRGVDASIAGHVSKASQYTKSKSRQSYRTNRDIDSDIDIKSNSSFWSDEDLGNQYIQENNQRKIIPHQRKISRYLSTVNRSLLDHPSDLIADFYLSQLNRNMQESVRHIETIARDKAYKQEFIDDRKTKLGRSLSAEHLYQVRKEHLRYKQPFTKPASFTAEDVADIYKRFVLENYKRKIAIELERRRRARQGSIYPSEPTFHQTRIRNDFALASPPIIVETKEIIMGRARRTLTKDGSSDIVHHISSVSPPLIYSSDKRSSSQTTANIVNQNRQDEIIITPQRPQTKLYTHIPQTNFVKICRANRIESDSDHLSLVNIEPITTLNKYETNSLTDQSYNDQLTQYTEQKPEYQRSTLIISIDAHISRIHEDIPLIEILQPTNLSIPPINKAHEISADSGISLNTSQINEHPTILNLPYPNRYNQKTEITNEPLPEYGRTIITNEIPIVDPLKESTPLASLLEDLSTAIPKQHATEIIDDNYYWKSCENTRIPIIVYDTEWKDEKVQIISDEFQLNIENAKYKYPENIEYEHIKINFPHTFEIINNNEQVTSLPDDSYLIQHKQQSNIHIDQSLYLENPIHSKDILTLNYPYHNKKQSNLSTISQTSSFIDMETFLTNFEESLDHEQHLPLIDQISLSYATSIIERNQQKYRSLPIEWFKPTILSHDEQLVEQWIVEKNIDTIQQEGTLNRQQVEFLTNTECDNIIFASSTDAFCINQRSEEDKSNNSILREHNIISHCSPTSDYETDSVEKDNDTVTSTVIIPITILPSSSITNLTLLSQSSPILTSDTAPIAPIVYFLDVLALEQKEINNSTKDFLLTIGFGQNTMNDVSTIDQPLRPTWINHSIDNIEILPTIIHHENQIIPSSIQQQIHFATENQIEEDDIAFLIYPHHLQYGHDLDENTQAPLSSFFQPSHLYLPMINEIYTYQMSFPFFYPPNILPQTLVSKTEEDKIFTLDKYQINQPEILSFARIDYLFDNEEETQPISIKFDQPAYIEHYHIQSLFPFPEICYADINQTEIITNNNHNNNFLSDFILTNEEENLLNRIMGQNTDNHPELNKFQSTSSVEVRPPAPTESGPIYEDVKMRQLVDVNMGGDHQYRKQSDYTYGSEKDTSQQQQKYTPFERTPDASHAHFNTQDDIYEPERIVEHISEDEKSTSSEEVVFEEWTEEFKCRRTDEYDRNTNRLVRTTIDETSGRIKGDIIKEQYKEKNTRIKGHKSYDVVKEIYRRKPTHVYEEISQPPPKTTSSKDRHWASEETYTTEIVHDSNLAKHLESTAQKFDSLTHHDRVRPSRYSPIPSTTEAIISTSSPTRYEHISNIVTPKSYYADKRKQEQEVVSEEYRVEFETPIKRDDLTDQQSLTRRNSDWRDRLKQIYNPTSDDDQHKKQMNGNYLAQRASVIPSNTQQRFKEVQIKIPGSDKTPPEQRKFEPLPPSKRVVKEVLVCISRGSSPEKQYHQKLIDENEQKKKKSGFLYSESPKKLSSTSPTDDDQPQPPKYPSSSSSSIINERRTQFESTYSRVGELKNTFETTTTTTSGNIQDDITKPKIPITTGLTEQRRRIFEEQEWTRRPIIERRLSETHTAPSIVSDRISRIESSTPQTSIDIKYKPKQIISSIDSDLIGPTKPIYQSTPKSIKQKQDEDAGHESEDELSDPKQNYDTRRRTSKTRLRDFSQSTSQPFDTTQTISKFNEINMENVLSHVPTSKGKGLLIELTTHTPESPNKSNLMSDSGVFDRSTTTTSHQLPTSSPSWRQNVSTSIIDDTTRSRDTDAYIDSTITTSPYTRRQISDADQSTIQNMDESISRSTYKYDREIPPNQQQQQQQQRIVRRQITNSPPTDYENLSNYHSRIDTQGKIPITTQSRSIKPFVVDEIETIETETKVECEVQRTNETKESIKTERISSPSKKILTTTTSRLYDETTPAKRVLLNERPQYYESTKDETRFQPIQRDHSQDNLSYRPSSHTMEVTSLSPTNQIRFDKYSPNEIIAVVRVPELPKGTSESNLYEKTKQEEERPRLHYQRVQASSYCPLLTNQNYQQRQSRSRHGPFETKNDYSSPISFPVRSASYHSNLHEQNQQPQQQYYPRTRYHSGSLANLFGSNLEFEIEIEKRPPQQPEQPTSVSLDQCSRAIVTTSKDGRVSIQNVAAYPGNTVVINSDFHSSDRSLNRSSGYFSSDEPRSQGHTTAYSSDELSTGPYQYSLSTSSPMGHYKTNEHIPIRNPSQYRFDQVNELVQNYSQPSNTSTNFNETIDQIDALYNNLDIQKTDKQTYDFSKLNRRKQLTQNPNEYSKRYTSTGFQQIPYGQQTTSDNNQNWTSSSSLTNLVMATPIRPSQSLSSSGILTDYGTPGSISPNSAYGSTQNMIVQQNRLNAQSQIVQRNRTSVKQVKQKSAAKKKNGNTQEQYSDEDDENDSPLSDSGRPQPSSRSYNFNNHHE